MECPMPAKAVRMWHRTRVFGMMLREGSAGNSLHIGKVHSRKSARKIRPRVHSRRFRRHL